MEIVSDFGVVEIDHAIAERFATARSIPLWRHDWSKWLPWLIRGEQRKAWECWQAFNALNSELWHQHCSLKRVRLKH